MTQSISCQSFARQRYFSIEFVIFMLLFSTFCHAQSVRGQNGESNGEILPRKTRQVSFGGIHMFFKITAGICAMHNCYISHCTLYLFFLGGHFSDRDDTINFNEGSSGGFDNDYDTSSADVSVQDLLNKHHPSVVPRFHFQKTNVRKAGSTCVTPHGKAI